MNPSTTPRKNKNLSVNQAKLDRAKEILGATTETETVELALEAVIVEAEHNETAWKATERFLKSRVEIRDVFGNLE